jgi:hypothetical protein
VRSLLDAGCGAMAWQPLLLDNVYDHTGRHVRYHGVDIVPGKTHIEIELRMCRLNK